MKTKRNQSCGCQVLGQGVECNGLSEMSPTISGFSGGSKSVGF